jgi:hypothetical protein
MLGSKLKERPQTTSLPAEAEGAAVTMGSVAIAGVGETRMTPVKGGAEAAGVVATMIGLTANGTSMRVMTIKEAGDAAVMIISRVTITVAETGIGIGTGIGIDHPAPANN